MGVGGAEDQSSQFIKYSSFVDKQQAVFTLKMPVERQQGYQPYADLKLHKSKEPKHMR